jgi:hypothetical protein
VGERLRDEGEFVDGAVLPVDKSNSADLFHVQRCVGGSGHVFIEWQQKFDVATALQMATVRNEVKKCNETQRTILIMFAATVGPDLLSLIESRDDKVLVLKSWSDDVAAVYVIGNGPKLFWRPADTQKWYAFPSQIQVFNGTVKHDAAIVAVRVGLEVVIPHHDVVRGLVGDSRFDTLVKAAAASASVESTSAVITSLDEVFANHQQQHQEEKQQQEQPSEEGPFAAYGNETKMDEVIRSIVQKETFTDKDVNEDLATLSGKRIRTVGNLRALQESDIKELGLPPVVFRYMMRVKQGH